MDKVLIDDKLNLKIEYVVTRKMAGLMDYKCGCDDLIPTGFRVKRSVKKYKAKPTPGFQRYLDLKRKDSAGAMGDYEDEPRYDAESIKANLNALRWRFACGRVWDHEKSVGENMALRCDRGSFKGFVDSLDPPTDLAHMGDEEQEEVMALRSVIWDNFNLAIEDRAAYDYKDTAYVPPFVYNFAMSLLEKDDPDRHKQLKGQEPPPLEPGQTTLLMSAGNKRSFSAATQ